MSNRIKGLTVVLQYDYKDEEVTNIINAIKMINGVDSVTAIEVDSNDYINRARIKCELRSKIMDIILNDF